MNDRSEPEAAYRPADLTGFATALLTHAGMPADRAACVAERLVEADLLGHTTHGLALCAGYLGEIASGAMAASGEPTVVADYGATAVWDGNRLSGLWLTAKAVDTAAEWARVHGIGSITIRNSHHIGCLAVFLEQAARSGLMVLLASSDPAVRAVAPYGGTTALFTPNPLAVGIPTGGDPILIDVSASITTMGLADRLRKEGKRFPAAWAMDAAGEATDDPAVLIAEPKGTLLPVGGVDHGHKGYALALIIEVLTQALSGFGRADAPTGWGASVWVQVIDPAKFGGLDAFTRQSAFMVESCHANPPRPGGAAVRLPGEQGLARKRAALQEGVRLYPTILPALTSWAERYGVAMPVAIGGAGRA